MDTAAAVTWFRIELAVNIGIVLSNIIFMSARAIFKHKILVDDTLDDRKKLPQIDTMIALQRVGNSWNNEALPFIISNFLWFFPASGRYTSDSILVIQQFAILICNYISVFSVFLMIFISWKKGCRLWVKIAPYLYYVLMINLYLVMPAANTLFATALILYPSINLKLSIFESWLVLYLVI